jgi:hypothetical protein
MLYPFLINFSTWIVSAALEQQNILHGVTSAFMSILESLLLRNGYNCLA